MSRPLISASDLSKHFGLKPLFERISLTIEERERVALIGPNGSGKSTLLRILAGLEEPDSGVVRRRNSLRLSFVSQQDTFPEGVTVYDVMAATARDADIPLDEIAARISVTLGKAGFHEKNMEVSALSGGWRKRLSVARGLLSNPEVLLLDEPTNHLDVEGIVWLEEFLGRSPGAVLFVSHDRYFIENLAERVIEINPIYPDGYFSSNGGYGDFLEARAAFLDSLRNAQASLANKVRREVAWLRQGAKARTTKSKFRTAEAGKLIEELKTYRLDERRVDLEFSSTRRRSKELIKVECVSKSVSSRTLFSGISCILSPGVRLGVLGVNGSGKTTFLKVLLGELPPDSGRVVRATNLRTAYFDQARRQIDPSMTLKQTLAPHSDSVVFQGRSIHIASWLSRFLLNVNQLPVPIQNLSGGEQARALLAKLMLEDADVLFFDEPTNDLDITTLEVLEESFLEFPGAIVLVTHDRYFLDRATTIVLGLHEGGGAMYGDFGQWEVERRKYASQKKNSIVPTLSSIQEVVPKTERVREKLTFAERKELGGIEAKIEKAEQKLVSLQERASLHDVISNPKELADCCSQLAEQQEVVDTLYSRWQELEAKRKTE
jgi:ABC transport system ATP-binding/permease protein